MAALSKAEGRIKFYNLPEQQLSLNLLSEVGYKDPLCHCHPPYAVYVPNKNYDS